MRALKCTAKKADGSPCLAPAMRGHDKCFFHSSNVEIEAVEKKKAEELDIVVELNLQLRRTKRLPPSLEKERLLLDIAKALREARAEPHPEVEKKPGRKSLL